MEVLLGLGANLGDPLAQLAHAVELLGRHMELRAVSSVYRTEPVGHADQPDFLNLVVVAWTELAPPELLATTQEVEVALGRERSFRNAPRVIDIDLLAYGDRVMRTLSLTLPHPRMHLRGFVLQPLVEIAAFWRHPVLGVSAAELLRALPKTERVESLGLTLRLKP